MQHVTWCSLIAHSPRQTRGTRLPRCCLTQALRLYRKTSRNTVGSVGSNKRATSGALHFGPSLRAAQRSLVRVRSNRLKIIMARRTARARRLASPRRPLQAPRPPHLRGDGASLLVGHRLGAGRSIKDGIRRLGAGQTHRLCAGQTHRLCAGNGKSQMRHTSNSNECHFAFARHFN
jgi:hypothetical protein